MLIASKICEQCAREYTPDKRHVRHQRFCSHNCWRKSTNYSDNKRYNLKNPERRILRDVKCRAKRKGLEFNLELKDIVIPTVCPILHILLEHSQNGRKHDASPSIDRVDNSKGYIKGNVRIISDRANTIKNSATIEELENVIKYMKEHLQ